MIYARDKGVEFAGSATPAVAHLRARRVANLHSPICHRAYKFPAVKTTPVNQCRTTLAIGAKSFTNMKHSFVLFCCLLVTVVSSTKISLEDIERDNINSEKRVKAQKSIAISRLPHPSPAHYGFVPMKTPAEYLQQPPVRYHYDEQQYYLSQGRHLTQTERPPSGYQPPQQKYITQQVKYVPQAIPPQKYVTQYVPQVQIQPPQQYSPPGLKEPKQYTQLTPPAPPSRVQIQPQQYQQSQPHQEYTPLSPLSQFQPNPEQLYRQQPNNVQYITDNSIAQPPQEAQKQQYYNTRPQFYYLQQSPSDNIQSVIDPKGGVQYVMYVPTYVPVGAQSQNYENVVYVTPEYAPQEQDEQVTQQQQQEQPEQPQQEQHQQQPTQYVLEYPSEKQVAESKPQIIIPQVRREPKSLLDSYIPSYLQIQYYKQQEHRARDNSLIQDLKAPPPPSGKSTPVKGRYRTINAQRSASSLVYKYRLPAYRTYVNE